MRNETCCLPEVYDAFEDQLALRELKNVSRAIEIVCKQSASEYALTKKSVISLGLAR